MEKDYGKAIRHDPDFKGPISNRSCTDILWLILFLLYMGVWGYVGFYGKQHGNIEKLLAPIDSYGNRCGLDSQVKDKKYLVFFDITKCLNIGTPIVGCPTPQVCVSSCPTRTIFFETDMTAYNFEQMKNDMVCSVDKTRMTYSEAVDNIRNQKCARYVLKSQAVLGRCVLDVAEAQDRLEQLGNYTVQEVTQHVSKLINFEQLSSQIVQDLVRSRWYLAGALVVVVLLCFLYILVLRWVVAPVVWTSIVGLIALLCFSMFLCYKQYEYYKANPVQLSNTNNLKGYAESWFTSATTWLVILCVVGILTVLLALIVIFLRGRITIAIALIKEGSKAVTAVKTTMIFPIFPWILQCGVIAYGVLVLMLLMSIGESTFKVVNLAKDTTCSCPGTNYTMDYVACDPATFFTACRDINGGPCQIATCHFTGLDSPHSVVYLHLANLLGFFWAVFFIGGVADMMLASTFSTWYWTFNKKDVPFFTLTMGISRTITYHLGTVALGSLIIAIVRVIRVILEYIDHKLKKFDNPFTRCLLCCCKCFFWCLENFLKFINKNAYIMCAVHGKNFCTSARDAFSLLMRNIIRVVVLDKVMDFIFFLSKLLISIGVGFAVYYLMEWKFVYDITKGEQLHYNYIPAIILSIATYLICTIFFNVYAMAVDTLFLCFLEDCERNDGSAEKPYFMSTNLMKILGKKNTRAT